MVPGPVWGARADPGCQGQSAASLGLLAAIQGAKASWVQGSTQCTRFGGQNFCFSHQIRQLDPKCTWNGPQLQIHDHLMTRAWGG